MCFHLIQSPEFPVILGYPWLLQHNPHFDWSTGAVLSWGPTCQTTCLAQNSPDPVLESQEPQDLSQVPAQYHHLKAVFSKRKAISLPPNRPYDCAIELHTQEPVPPEVVHSLCLPPNELLWTNTSTKPLRQESSKRPLPMLELDSFSFSRRMADFGLVLITGALIR